MRRVSPEEYLALDWAALRLFVCFLHASESGEEFTVSARDQVEVNEKVVETGDAKPGESFDYFFDVFPIVAEHYINTPVPSKPPP